MLSTRHDVEIFLQKMAECKASPLLVVTGGVHLHTLEVPDESTLKRIQQELKRQGILEKEA
jgi:transcriptional regulator of NAD metabolism